MICVSLVTNRLVAMSTAVPCPCRGNLESFTPLKIDIWNPKKGRFASDDFPFHGGDFQGFSVAVKGSRFNLSQVSFCVVGFFVEMAVFFCQKETYNDILR